MISLPFGRDWLPCEPPGEVTLLAPARDGDPSRQAALIARALDEPQGTPALRELGRGRRSAVVLVSCRTRRIGSRVFLPEIVSRLSAAGIPDERILVYVASGTHDNFRNGDAELLAGPELAGRLRFAGHDCRGDLVHVGRTSRGTRVDVARVWAEADLRIATGRVTHHYFAGFTGGRKAVLPGVSGFETILQNHRLTLTSCSRPPSADEPAVGLHPEARNGCLVGNPVHEDMLEGARLAAPDLTLSTVLDPGGTLVAVFAGDLEGPHAAAVSEVTARDVLCAPRPADLLLLSCGGDPCDVNAVQALKAIVGNYRAVRPGGAIVFVAECAEGMVPWLFETCSVPAGELAGRIASGGLRHPHNALWIRRVCERVRVFMVTCLSEEQVRALGFERAGGLDDAIERAVRVVGSHPHCVAVPFGNTSIVEVSPASRRSD